MRRDRVKLIRMLRYLKKKDDIFKLQSRSFSSTSSFESTVLPASSTTPEGDDSSANKGFVGLSSIVSSDGDEDGILSLQLNDGTRQNRVPLTKRMKVATDFLKIFDETGDILTTVFDDDYTDTTEEQRSMVSILCQCIESL